MWPMRLAGQFRHKLKKQRKFNGLVLTPEALKEIQELHARGLVLTAEQMTEFNALYSDDFPGSRIFQKVGTVAQVNIAGVLTKEPNWMYRYYGGGNTAYSEIISAINEAERDPAIKEIILAIDSPGGQTNGLCSAMDAIKKHEKNRFGRGGRSGSKRRLWSCIAS